MKYIIVTGGVVSGLGKGITISSIGRVMKACGLSVTSIKIDPYLNVDAGTMSPFEHGETFVLDDGGETDLDLGNYERFLDITLTGRHNITTGKIYRDVIHQERRGDYLGKTVQIVPHVTDLVQEWIKAVSRCPVDGTGQTPDVCLIEVGGTVGDIESMVFLEALRQFQFTVGRQNVMLVHLSLVPCLGSVGEQKTKPTQHSVKELRSIGLFPDIIVCRSSERVSEATRAKMSIFCQVPASHVLSVHDVSNIYHVPLILVEQGVHNIIKETLGLEHMAAPDLTEWSTMARRVDSLKHRVSIAIVGKYNGLSDSYLSVLKSITHCGIHLDVHVDVVWIDSADLETQSEEATSADPQSAWGKLKAVSGIIVPGGFGIRGVEGKILAARYARKNQVPYLGLCLGLQVMVIEYVRDVLNKPSANSVEFDEHASVPAVVFMPEINASVMGGTMRLGARGTRVARQLPNGETSIAWEAYGLEACTAETADLPRKRAAGGEESSESQRFGLVWERHRHRYEVNPSMVPDIEAKGLYFSGRDDTDTRMEVAELPRSVHPYYVAAQFHPELKSRPNRPSPLFYGLVAHACIKKNIDLAFDFSKSGVMWQAHEQVVNPQPEPSAAKRLRLRSCSSLGLPTPPGSPVAARGPAPEPASPLTKTAPEAVAGACSPIATWK